MGFYVTEEYENTRSTESWQDSGGGVCVAELPRTPNRLGARKPLRGPTRIEGLDYDAFGTIIAQAATDPISMQLVVVSPHDSTLATPNSYLYCGEQYDHDLGLYFLRARYMDTSRGRFWSMDTFEGMSHEPASLHAYLYANGNPIRHIDPSGHISSLTEYTIVVALVLIIDIAALYTYDYLRGGHDPVSDDEMLSERFDQFAGPGAVDAEVNAGINAWLSGGQAAVGNYFAPPRPRYAFDQRGGFIDLQHVAAAAGFTMQHPVIGGALAGVFVEGNQWLGGWVIPFAGTRVRRDLRHSAWNKEDLLSNAIGEWRGHSGHMPTSLMLLDEDAAMEALYVE